MATTGPRERLLLSAIALMCERGVHATGLADLLARSRTARQSIYQHFPGGKIEMMEQATYLAGSTISDLLDQLLASTQAPGAINALIDGVIDYWKHMLEDSDYTMGCPILAASESGPSAPGIQAAAASVFAAWTAKIDTALRQAGVDSAVAKPLASTTVSSIEGAVAQSRSARSIQPLEDVRKTLHLMMTAVLPSGD